MKKALLVFAIAGTLLITLSACQSSVKNSKVSNFEVNNLVIPLPETGLYLQEYVGRNMTQPISFHENGKDYMAVYNNKLHALDLFNLTDKVAAQQIMLQKEGPDGVLYPYGIAYYKGQFIFDTAAGLKRVDKEGRVTLTRPIPAFESLSADGYSTSNLANMMRVSFLSFFYMDAETGTVAVPFYPPGINESAVSLPYVVMLYDLESTKEERIEIPYPKEFSSQKQWGALNMMQVSFQKDLLFISFAGSTTIYTYNRKTKAYNQYPVNTALTPTLIKPEDGKEGTSMNDDNGYSLKAGYYNPLQYDPFRDVYWRLYVGATKTVVFDFNRPFCLTMLSSDFQLIKEIPFPDDLGIYPPPIIGKERLWMSYINAKAEEELWLLEVPSNVLQLDNNNSQPSSAIRTR